MKIAFFSARSYDEEFFNLENKDFKETLQFFETHLNEESAHMATGSQAVCVFSNDIVNQAVLTKLVALGVKIVALRCNGYNNIDLEAAKELGVTVVHVPWYSPEAIAEYTIGMMLTLNRKYHKAYNRVREDNFTIDGLMGFDMHGKTVGIIGTGHIGTLVVQLLSKGFGCRILAYDTKPSITYENNTVQYVSLAELYAQSDIITLHCPLTPETYHLINKASIDQMKPGMMLINTSRGGVIQTEALIEGLKSKKIGYLGLDVYEEEAELFSEDFSHSKMPDELLARLISFPNVLVTAHQAFFTKEAMQAIACTTLSNIQTLEQNQDCPNQLLAQEK